MKSKLNLEALEARDCPAPMATAVLSGGVLAITGTNQADVVLPTGAAGNISLVLNGQTSTFTGVTSIVADLKGGDDNFQNNSGLPSVVNAGRGNDVVYNILSPLTVFAQDGKNETDRIYHGPVFTSFVDTNDREVTFFAAGRTIGAGTVVAGADGVLYVTPGATASTLALTSQGNNLILTGDLGTGAGVQTWTFASASVHTVAYFGSPQNDSFLVTADIDVIGYGGAGNDTLVATSTSKKTYQEWKGLAGNDLIFTAAGRTLVNGGAGADVLIGPRGTIVQGDAADLVFVPGFGMTR